MSATPREIVQRTLNYDNPPRAARDCWVLPLARSSYPAEVDALMRDFPPDMTTISGFEQEPPPTRGDMFAIGEYVDEWGCTFVNIQEGVIGEVKQPIVEDWAADRGRIRFPRGWLTLDRDRVNRAVGATNLYTAPAVCPRPFEQLQFIRGSENVYLDIAEEEPAMLAFLREMHAFYCEVYTAWARTDIDALRMMDDWGAQRSLLISPEQWRRIFKPLYRDYVQIAHSHGKKFFMHSDGMILSIYPDLVEIGVDAINSQIFCMGPEALKPFAGKITFWGEIDRQRLLVSAEPAEVDRAVRDVHAALWRNGGCIAQCEYGPGAKPPNVRQVYETWSRLVG